MFTVGTDYKKHKDSLTNIGIGILNADYFEVGPNSKGWVIKVSVERGDKEVVGWVFRDANLSEIRFEYLFSGNPPAFICGCLHPVSHENNSLCMLLDHRSLESIEEIEDYVRSFIDQCIFCVKTLHDVNRDISYTKAISWSMVGAGRGIPMVGIEE